MQTAERTEKCRVLSLITLTFDLELQTQAQIHSAVPKILHTQTKKNTYWWRQKTEPSFTACHCVRLLTKKLIYTVLLFKSHSQRIDISEHLCKALSLKFWVWNSDWIPRHILVPVLRLFLLPPLHSHLSSCVSPSAADLAASWTNLQSITQLSVKL